MGLASYRQKRDFDATPEPPPRLPRSRRGHSFVVQKHDASRLHYDFRLELDGVLKSWAVPKGPSLAPGDKRLAMEVEDHPVDYRDFEGVIPEGHYGAGAVIVWDRGHWEPLGDAHAGLAKGHLRFRLHGEKLQGEYSLVRIKGDGDKKPAWLLFKRSDEHAREGADADITAAQPLSVKSGRSLDEVAADATPRRRPGRSRASAAEPRAAKAPTRRRRGARVATAPKAGSIAPQLCTLVDRAPRGNDLVFEIKYDGYRLLAHCERGTVQLVTRNGLDWSARFPGIRDALAALPLTNAVLDGEACYVMDDGRTDFQHLQNALKARSGAEQQRLVYFVFDLLFVDGEDWRERPLLERHARLAELLAGQRGALRLAEHVQGDGPAILSQACALGLEGVIAKRGDRPYRPGRGPDWVKVKCGKRQEFVIVGMTAPGGARSGFGALLLAVREGERLRYAGKVGTGFSERSLGELSARLRALQTDTPPVTTPTRERGVTWVRPELVCEVSFTEFTRDGILRHPSFEGLREDKSPRQVVREEERPVGALARKPPKRAGTQEMVGGVRISNAQRVMDEASGVTKGDLARYHHAVAAHFLPYAVQRPLALVRCPEGGAHECFFQKHAVPGFSDAIGRADARTEEVIYVRDEPGVLELVQFGAVEFHGWGSRLPELDRPDWVVFDFDPDVGLDFGRVVEAAQLMREQLAALQLESFVKTTGGKGLHVVVPLAATQPWDRVKGFAQALARSFAQVAPERYVAVATKKLRAGRIFVDYLRNGRGATAVLPFSPRARSGATVAMPLAWKDLAHLDPREFTVRSVPRLLTRRRKDPWAGLLALRQEIPAAFKAPG